MKRKEVMELIGSVIASIVASVAAAFVFWWLTMYSVLCERDVAGTVIVVWCAVVIRIMLWAEKKGEEEK